MRSRPYVLWALLPVAAGLAQSPKGKPFQARSSSSISYGTRDGSETVEITNVAYEVTGGSHLVLRTTTHSTQVIGDKGVDSVVTMEAWPLGIDPQTQPLYSIKTPGIGAQTVDGALWVADRSIDPDVSWWSVYRLGTGQHLFDTYVELLRFSISREEWTQRYAGLDVPPDDTKDSRLKDPRVVAILTYASADKVIRQALLTCDNRQRASVLRSYADSSRTLTHAGRSIRVAFSQNYPSPANQTVISIPIVKDDLDLVHAQLPPGFRVAAWKR